MDTVLGLDFGTQGAKGIIMKSNGEVVASSYCPYRFKSNQHGWVEENPMDWWKALGNICSDLKSFNHTAYDSVSAIGLSGQMHGIVFIDGGGCVLRDAIIWMDNRSMKQCDKIRDLLTEKERLNLANPITTAFTAPKLLWVKENEEEVWSKTEKVLFAKDFIKYRLCGSLCTDHSDASGTLFYNFKSHGWDNEILSKLNISGSILPEILSSSGICGRLTAEASKVLGLKAGVPVVNGGGDLACGLLGSGITEDGTVSIILGTAGQVLMMQEEVNSQKFGSVYYFKYLEGKKNFALGALNSAGYCLRWMMDILGNIDDFGLLEKEAGESSIGALGLLFLPYLRGTGSPYMDETAKGAFVGLGSHHCRKDLIRALMEGVILGLKDSVELLKGDKYLKGVRFAGGGSRSPLWKQILSDVLGCNITTLEVNDASPYGAALCAAVGIGMSKDLLEASKLVKIRDYIACLPENAQRYMDLYEIYKELYAGLKKAYDMLEDFNVRY